ncbi:single-stranded-DNA-specific exonuclease RecJ [Candidatus Dojkabacteria bacterium]|jgi:single-stranded-DNA-specific exonuclease|nr:single-stranded-DNA-specific exonuclease RecJ [Candidatus Dojkabacteria bacterium]
MQNIRKPKEILDEIIKKRGIEDIRSFLNPQISDIPSFKKLYNAKAAAQKIIDAVNAGKRIYIHGDYDCDGVCSTAILFDFLYFDLAKFLSKKIDVKPYIPDRVDEGYGLSETSINAMIEDGAKLIITVDCGIRDRERIEKYLSDDLDVIVTDHHQPPEKFGRPKYTIVHQMYPSHAYPYEKICGAAVAFLLVQNIKELVGMKCEIKENTKGLDLLALATVTDMMPLLDVNRVFVTYGLKQIQKNSRLGITALSRLSSVEIEKLDSYHLGFVIGPRINAAGRIGKTMDALKLVLAKNEKTAIEYSSKLFNLNVLRQENTQEILLQVETLLPDYKDDSLIFIHGEGWHEGVIGLAAAKLFERFNKPVVITTLNAGIVKGSARSFAAFNITSAIEQFSEHLTKYGGHAQAAGFSTTPEQLDEFRKKLVDFANKNISPDLLVRHLDIDAQLYPKEVSLELFNELEKLKPFGYGNNKPLIEIKDLEIVKIQELSNGKHLKLNLKQGEKEIIGMIFYIKEDNKTDLKEGNTISIIGNLNTNEWNGNIQIQVIIKEWDIP